MAKMNFLTPVRCLLQCLTHASIAPQKIVLARDEHEVQQERLERARFYGKTYDEVPGAEALVVRVVSSVDNKLEVKQRFLEIFQEENYHVEFGYKSKGQLQAYYNWAIAISDRAKLHGRTKEAEELWKQATKNYEIAVKLNWNSR
ncbi:unnamed protein product [Lactuca saligna]|uniref:Uncharacterized protein n=1 Tax=Lactuca saligna TaxID=75948 RepID=A0AA35VCE1_LACSI|nr:unnamed protein product [Lactuca saligna]